jgi:hypothetical protein
MHAARAAACTAALSMRLPQPREGRIVMRRTITTAGSLVAASAALLAILAAGAKVCAAPDAGQEWKVHDPNRPEPPVITPGTGRTPEQAGQPPSDATVLFDGKDLTAWRAKDGGPAKWKIDNGYLEVVPQAGDIHTRQAFGDCQLHVEWATPNPPQGGEYDRGNSGVYLMGLYEVQIFDSYQHKLYADGEAAAIYGQYPPLVNACRPPGQWQTYDIIFHGPRFDRNGKLLRPAYVTALHNGVLVQDHVALTGPTQHQQRPPYQPHPEKLPLLLQEHNNPVRFRNVWIRELPEPGVYR